MLQKTLIWVCFGCTTIACQTREIGSVDSGASGKLVYSDDFERAELGESWRRGVGEGGAGQWTIEDGWVAGRDIKNDPLWLTTPLPRKVRVEFDAKSLSPDGDLKVEIFGDGEQHESGYIIIFGGWKNSLDVTARLDEHGDDRKSQPSRKVTKDKVHRIAVERADGPLKWFVDGKLVMAYEDPSPLTGPDHAFFAFNDWAAPVRFDNLKVYDLGP